MYDPWGVGEALRSNMRMYSHSKRATGRSDMLMRAVQDGDTVVVAHRQEAGRLEHELRRMGKDVRIMHLDPHEGLGPALTRISERYDRRGFLYFDHTWFEAMYLYEIERTMKTMNVFRTEMDLQRVQKGEGEARSRIMFQELGPARMASHPMTDDPWP